MAELIIAVFLLQGLLMTFDEFYFHHRRGLPRWERIGHPVDTLSVIACLSMTLSHRTPVAEVIFWSLAVISCIVITKDEFVHAKLCDGGEHWVHSVLFGLHPVVLIGAFLAWQAELRAILVIETTAAVLFCVYQIIFWNFIWKQRQNQPDLDFQTVQSQR